MSTDSSTYTLAERIAQAELDKAIAENRVRSPEAFARKVRDNMLERAEVRGAGWLVEQAMRFGVEIPHELQQHKPTRDEINAKKPAICPACGMTVPFDPTRAVRMIDGWPFSVKQCAMRRRDDFEACNDYRRRAGFEPAIQQIGGLTHD
ncbi:MAG: hypothetical protein ACR2JV_02000 [Gaiellales bacterium]